MTKKAFGNPSKWVESIKYQLEDIENSIVNTQFVNIEQVILDPNNSRTINLSLEEIKNGPKLPIGEFNEENQSLFETFVKNYFKDHKDCHNKISDYMDLSSLAASIKNPDNLMNPITVYLGNNMQFNLVAGHRRTLAHYIMDSKRICARILITRPSELDVNLLQWSENQDREDLSLSDQLNAINKIILSWETDNCNKITLGKLIALLSIKKTKAAWLLKLHKTQDREILDLIKKGHITSIETAYKLISISDKNERDIVISKLLSGNIKNAKLIGKEVRPPNQTAIGIDNERFVGKTKLKLSDLDISIKSQNGLRLFDSMITTLNKSNFYLTLQEEDKKLWNAIINHFNKANVNA